MKHLNSPLLTLLLLAGFIWLAWHAWHQPRQMTEGEFIQIKLAEYKPRECIDWLCHLVDRHRRKP